MKKKIKLSHVLREAKKYLWDGVGSAYYPSIGTDGFIPYLCVCVQVAGKDLGAYNEARVLKNKINRAIGGELTSTIVDWLAKNGVETWRYDTVDFQEYRKRYLDYLITQFEEAGK